jgi:glutaredoxin
MLLSASCVNKYQLNNNGLRIIDEEADVIIYTTDWCGICDYAKLFLDLHDILYIELNFDNVSEQRRLLLIAKDLNYTGRLDGVPIFIIGEHIELGFNPEQLLKILENHDIL